MNIDDDAWTIRLYELSEWCISHDELPNLEGASATEVRLAQWLHAQVHTATAFQQLRLDSVAPGWRDHGTSWFGTAGEVSAFVATTGRLPNSTAEGDERRLGKWLVNTRYALRRRHDWIGHSRRAWLDAHLPGWADPITLTVEIQWQARAAEYATFVERHGRHPSRGSSSPAEQRLVVWRMVQRRAAAGKAQSRWTPARAHWLDAHAPGWRPKRSEVRASA